MNMKTIKDIHAYWKNCTDPKNIPEKYLVGKKRTQFLIKKISEYSGTKNSILEIGCNCGRNLSGLWEAGYKNLTGIEINPDAIEVMQAEHEKMFNKIKIGIGPAETELKKIKSGSVDIIFTMAVLEHIHSDSAMSVFLDIKRICKKNLIIIEDEKKISDRHFTRNYKDIFESIGFTEIEASRCNKIQGLGKNYNLRIFKNGK